MRIAVINETSAGDRNGDVVRALDGRGHEIVNCGMKKGGEAPELTYIHTGVLAGLLLGAGRVDLVVGGCGTGIGFLNAALQMPGVICGLIQNPSTPSCSRRSTAATASASPSTRPRPNIRVTSRHLVHARRPCHGSGCRRRPIRSARHSACASSRGI